MTQREENVTGAVREYQLTEKWHMTQHDAAEFALSVCDNAGLNQDERFLFLMRVAR